MIASQDLGKNKGFFKMGKEIGREKKVVNAPADVSGTGISTLGPPSILVGFLGVEVAKAVNQA